MTITETTETPSVFECVRRVIDDVGGVGRDGYNDHQNFKFRSIEGTVNAVRPSLLLHGLTIVPSYRSIEQSDYTKSDGQVVHRSVLEGTYQFVGPGGDDFYVTTIGEALDTQGRATNKSMSACLKYALLQTFFIGSGDDGDSADISHTPVTATISHPVVQTAAAQVAQRAQQVATSAVPTPPRQDTGETRSEGQGKNLFRLSKKLESEQGWSRNDYLDQIELVSGFRDDRQLTKSQASDLIKTLKEFAGEVDEPQPQYQGEF